MTSAIAERVIDCKGCGGSYDPAEEVHLCYGQHPDHPLCVSAPTLAAFMESDAFVRIIVGPVGSGKSSVSINEILRRAAEVPACRDRVRRSRYVVIRNTYGELSDTTKKTFDQWVPNPSCICTFNKNEFVATVTMELEDGTKLHSEILFRALDRDDHVAKLLSLELTGAYLNEVKEIPKAILDVLGTRVGRFPSRSDVTTKDNPEGTYWHGIWADTNPCDTDHWLFKLFEKSHRIEVEVTLPDGSKQSVVWELFKQPSGLSDQAENLAFLPPGYYQRETVGKDEDWINVYLRGNWGFVREGKPVYPEWNDQLHCAPVVALAGLPILLGMDFGLTPAAVIAQRVPGMAQLQVLDELVGEDLGAVAFTKTLAQKLAAEYPGRPVRGFGDPAGDARSPTDEKTVFDILHANGFPGVVKAPTNDPVRRQEAVRGLLTALTFAGKPGLLVDPKALVLRKGFMGGYCRARVRVAGEARFKDEPTKNRFSHIHDGLQYLAVGEGFDAKAIHGTAKHRRVRLPFTVKRSVKPW